MIGDVRGGALPKDGHTPSHAGTWGIGLIYTVSVCDSHMPFPAIGFGGWGR